MKLSELLTHLGTSQDVIKMVPFHDFTLVVHKAGEPADEVVDDSCIYENKSIYLEYD